MGITTHEIRGSRFECRQERLGAAGLYDHAAVCRAALPGEAECSPRNLPGCARVVAIRPHDGRVVTAQLGLQWDQA